MSEQRSGHVAWGAWLFDYAVTDTEGLALLSGYFRGRPVFHKLSLPVIRVKYVHDSDLTHNSVFKNGCGPYNDQISWDPDDFGEDLLNWLPGNGPHHLVQISDCGDRYICLRETMIGSTTYFEVGVYARIGAYHIYQSWYLNNGGDILPRVFSKGLSCNLDHWHHPYWRFDLDLGEAGHQRVQVLEGSKVLGYVNHEGRLFNNSNGQTRYRVDNLRNGMKAWVIPPALDSESGVVAGTAFSPADAYVRKYRPEEDIPWPHRPENDIGFGVHENPDDSDVVFWSIAHLQHHAAEGKDHWHQIGPQITFELPEASRSNPADVRRIGVTGHIHLKDFKLIGKDKWGHFDFSETRVVDSGAVHAEVDIQRGPVGDTRARLQIRIDRNPDNSVGINFTAELFDSGESVAKVEKSFNVLRGSAVEWSGMHLADYHRGDPDTVDMDFSITNGQA